MSRVIANLLVRRIEDGVREASAFAKADTTGSIFDEIAIDYLTFDVIAVTQRIKIGAQVWQNLMVKLKSRCDNLSSSCQLLNKCCC